MKSDALDDHRADAWWRVSEVYSLCLIWLTMTVLFAIILRHELKSVTENPVEDIFPVYARIIMIVKNIGIMLAIAAMIGCQRGDPPVDHKADVIINAQSAVATGHINNTDVVPPFRSDDLVTLEPSDAGSLLSPDWTKTLIIVQLNIQHASTDGRFTGMKRALDHLQEMGVNGVWITPINDGGEHYANFGPYTLNPRLTGKSTYEEGWPVVKAFVDEAHQRNIRVFFDVVSWGTHKKAPLYTEKPDWYTGKEEYSGYCLDWTNPELCEWFTTGLVDMILKTGADGLRADCAPGYAGYLPYRNVRNRLLEKGRKIIVISESASERKGTFDFDQLFKDGKDKFALEDFYFRTPIVDGVKKGTKLGVPEVQVAGTAGKHRFYSFCVSCHDHRSYKFKGNPIVIGYQALFAPRIPMWYLGDEWNNPHTASPYWLWASAINWDKIEESRSFYEQVKKMIRIRRQYSGIFEFFPENQRDGNICSVSTSLGGGLEAYARYANGVGILIVPNNSEEAQAVQVSIPFAEMGLDLNANYVISDLLTETQLPHGATPREPSFTSIIPAKNLGVYLVKTKSK